VLIVHWCPAPEEIPGTNLAIIDQVVKLYGEYEYIFLPARPGDPYQESEDSGITVQKELLSRLMALGIASLPSPEDSTDEELARHRALCDARILLPSEIDGLGDLVEPQTLEQEALVAGHMAEALNFTARTHDFQTISIWFCKDEVANAYYKVNAAVFEILSVAFPRALRNKKLYGYFFRQFKTSVFETEVGMPTVPGKWALDPHIWNKVRG